jgi:hypothetical protein
LVVGLRTHPIAVLIVLRIRKKEFAETGNQGPVISSQEKQLVVFDTPAITAKSIGPFNIISGLLVLSRVGRQEVCREFMHGTRIALIIGRSVLSCPVSN